MSEEIQIIGNHPHAGERGTMDGSDMVLNGRTMLLIDLLDCRHGVERCYATPEHIGRVSITPLVTKRKTHR